MPTDLLPKNQSILSRELQSFREDGRKVLQKISGKRPGKPCGGSYISAEKQCKSHNAKTATGKRKLTEEGKAAAQKLADKVRARKGMKPKSAAKKDKPREMTVRERREMLRRKYGAPGESGSRASMLARQEEKRQQVGRGNDDPVLSARRKRRNAVVEEAIRRIEKAENAPTPKPKKEITSEQVKTSEDRAKYAQQEAKLQRSQGNESAAKAWEKEASSARRSAIARDLKIQSQSQTNLFGVTEFALDMPLFAPQSVPVSRGKKSEPWAGDNALPMIPKRSKTYKGRNIDSADSDFNTDADTGKYKICGRGWNGIKGNCKRNKKGTGVKNARKQSAIALAQKVKAEKAAKLGQAGINELKAKTEKAIAQRKAKLIPKTITEVDPRKLTFDPKRFQYKLIHREGTGASGSLIGVKKWDDNLAGVLQVWRDPKDGKDYVVNGHNRAAKAIELGAQSVAVRYLNVPTAKEARSIGALSNIAEGRGNALDAAKFFRDSGLSREDLEAKGIPMREKIATDGLALSRLAPHLFNKVVQGDIPTERAVLIGDRVKNHDSQSKLVDLIDKETKKGRKITNDVVRELADIVQSAPTKSELQFSLFGTEETSRNLAIEKADLMADVRKRLSREKKLFGVVSKSKAASELERGGNQIDRERSREISDQASQTLAIFDKLKNQSGAVSSAINRAVERIANGENSKQVKDDLHKQLLSDIPEALGLGKRPRTQSVQNDFERRRSRLKNTQKTA